MGTWEVIVKFLVFGEFWHGIARVLEHSLWCLGHYGGVHARLRPDAAVRMSITELEVENGLSYPRSGPASRRMTLSSRFISSQV
jgi:hypothetical protein